MELFHDNLLLSTACVGTVVATSAWFLSLEKSQRNNRDAEYDAFQQERARLAYLKPRDELSLWTEAELERYNGTDETGPLLMAADGYVFNVWKGRHFYGPGGAYHLFAGRDATRLLAKTMVEEETPEERAIPLTMGERAALAGWMWTFKSKYEIVGRLENYNPQDTSM